MSAGYSIPRANVRNKFNAVRTQVGELWFASKKEARRYAELEQMRKAGEISDLILQPSFDLCAHRAGQYIKVRVYKADFAYRRKDGTKVVEDVKGRDTPVSRLKRAWLKAQDGIEVVLT